MMELLDFVVLRDHRTLTWMNQAPPELLLAGFPAACGHRWHPTLALPLWKCQKRREKENGFVPRIGEQPGIGEGASVDRVGAEVGLSGTGLLQWAHGDCGRNLHSQWR